ncbi:MAG: hypothetical protein AAGF22_00855 [Pseudomonadota bacterium]
MTSDAKLRDTTRAQRRTFKWLLGGQVFLAVLLVLSDAGTMVPQLLTMPSAAPELDRPTRPGDQTRRYRPSDPSLPGQSLGRDMPSQLTITSESSDTVSLRGAIAPGDGARISSELRLSKPSVVTLDSVGGSVTDALEIGRSLRSLGVETQIIDEAVCFSACPYIFVGGTTRVVAETGRLGVHQHSVGSSTILPAFLVTQEIQSGQAEVLEHLDGMGIDLRIMGPVLATPADEIYILTQTELEDWNVISTP